jgi:hypothetical protein
MIQLASLRCDSSIRLPLGTLDRSVGGWITVSTESGESRLSDAELADADELLIALGTDALLAFGEESHTVIGWDAKGGCLRILGCLARLDLPGYDPGGLYRVLMHPLDGDRLLVETEVGFSLVDLTQGVMWSRIHDDLTARVDRVSSGVIYVDSESANEEFSLIDGSYLGGKPRA